MAVFKKSFGVFLEIHLQIIFTDGSIFCLGFASEYYERGRRWDGNRTGLAMSWFWGLGDGQREIH